MTDDRSKSFSIEIGTCRVAGSGDIRVEEMGFISSRAEEGERERTLSAARASVFDLRGARRVSPLVRGEDGSSRCTGLFMLDLSMGFVPSTAIEREEVNVPRGLVEGSETYERPGLPDLVARGDRPRRAGELLEGRGECCELLSIR